MQLRVWINRLSTSLGLFAAGHPIVGRAEGKSEVICTYLRAPPEWDMPSPALYAFLGLVAFFAFCAVVVLIQSSRRNRVLEEQVAALMRANARDLPGISNRS
jgi:hypothetical protein